MTVLQPISDRLQLWGLGTFMLLGMTMVAVTRRERATHENGISAAGKIKIVDHPEFPDHDFFRPGREFPCRLRHTTIGFMDDALLEVRSASLKFSDQNDASPLDLEMNSGPFPPTPNAYWFWKFARATMSGRYLAYEKYFQEFPRGLEPAQTGLRRNPTTFAQMYYYSQTVFHFKARDGKTRYVKYRLIPQDRGPETGLHDEKDIWNQKRLPNETRSRDYLRQEYRERLSKAPVQYHLQLQVHEWQPDDTEEIFAPDRAWQDPWLDLATVTIDRVLPYAQGQQLVFSISHQPPSLGVIKAKSVHDYNSLNYLRVRMGPAKKARILAYKWKGIPAEHTRYGGGSNEDKGTPYAEASVLTAEAIKFENAAPLKSRELVKRYDLLAPAQKLELAATLDRLAAEQGKTQNKNLTHRALGQLLFEYPTAQGDKPLHHLQVELWDRDVGRPDDFLARGETDRDGKFELWYDPADAGWNDTPDLELRVFETHHTFRADGSVELAPKLIHVIKGDDNVTAQTYDFGARRIPYWEYDPNAPIARVLITEQGDPPQAYGPGRTTNMVKQVAPLEVVKRKHLLKNKLDPDKPTIPEIQADYPDNLTQRLERERPGFTRCDEFFGDRILNGLTTSILNRDPQNPNRYWLYHHWNSYAQDGEHVLPNVDMRFEIRGEKLYPVQITLGLRERGQTAPNAPVKNITVTPADGDKWAQAKRVARTSATLSAELDAHLATTHLNVEQYAIAAYRNLRKNPIRFLLFPHIKETVLINHSADSFLLGETGHITRAAALTADALVQRVGEVVGTLDWKNWQPRRALCESHTFAYAENLFWDVLTEYVDEYVKLNEAEIRTYWYEIHRFSDDLVEHSAPFFMCHYLRGQTQSAIPSWFAGEERMDVTFPRVVANDVPRAVQPLTTSDTPTAEDMENLKQVCRYVIMHATFMHTWPNSRQYDDGGELLYTCLGLRYGDNGVFVPESDLSIAPDVVCATEQLWISYFLSNGGYGFILKNEDRDIHPALLTALRKRKDQFSALGIDVDTIQSRTNI